MIVRVVGIGVIGDHHCFKKSLKISNRSKNRRRTDNAMAKRKRTNNDLQNITQKTPQKPGVESKHHMI